jgi:hypothetical protein
VSGLKRLGLFMVIAASLGALGSLTLSLTGASALVGERYMLPGFGRIERIVWQGPLPRTGWSVQCTYFTGHSLYRTTIPIEPCRTFAPACPTPTCPFLQRSR